MANQTITQLPSAGPITGTELIPLVQNGQTVKATVQAINSSPTMTQTFLTVNQEPTLTNSQYLAGGSGVGLVSGGAQSYLRIVLNGASGSLEGIGNGMVAKNASNTVVARTMTASGAGLGITNGDGVSGNPTFALTGVAAAVANLGGTGIMAIQSGTTVGGVQILGTTNQIAVANGNGTGNPTVSIVDNVVLPGTGAMTIPSGTDLQEPSGAGGQIRYNTDQDAYYGYSAGQWRQFSLAGGVTQIDTGTGLTGGPITATGTISIADTGVTAASYGAASKTLAATVNAQGQLTSLAETPIAIANTQVSGLGTASTLDAGVANGVATLDAGGTVPLSQIPASIQGGLIYQGTWNASTNTPTLTSGVGTKGYYYAVAVAGTTNLDGITDWNAGDLAVFNGTVWEQIDNTDAVTSVNGYTGTVVLTASDIGGLGTMATQNANNVAITGGAIDNTVIGGTTPAAGTFTTLTPSSVVAASTALNISTSDGITNFQVKNDATSGTAGYVYVIGASASLGRMALRSSKAFYVASGSSNPLALQTGSGVLTEGTTQLNIAHTASAVNYVQVTGAATGGAPTITSQGSDSNIGLAFKTKGTYNHTFYNGSSQTGFEIAPSGSANWLKVSSSNTTVAPVLSAQGSDTNISQVFQSKGTGAIDLAAGSSGVNISNGGTVTALTMTNNGTTAYTSHPTPAITAPTTAGGVQATASSNLYYLSSIATTTIVSGGTGYTLNDVLTVSGGTFTAAATFTVSAVSGGVITAITATTGGTYSVIPTGTLSVTGGTGTGFTFTINGWGIRSLTITNAGSGYVEQPTVSFSGGGGSGAAAYASVGGTPKITSLANTIDFYVASSVPAATPAFQVTDGGGSGTYVRAISGPSNAYPALFATGAANVNFAQYTSGTGTFIFKTASGGADQFRVSHTASAVNYVQVTGAATGSGNYPTISSQGSDAAVNLRLSAKGTGTVDAQTNSTTRWKINSDGSVDSGISASGGLSFKAVPIASQVNYLQSSGGIATNAPILSAQGTDTNISQVFQTKGTGAIDLAAGSSGVNISNGGTVTAITRTAAGTFYTSIPTLTISAPTTAGGVQATATPQMAGQTLSVQTAGTGYAVGNTLTVVGGTFSVAAQIRVDAIDGSGGVTSASFVNTAGAYSVLPTNPVSVTGGAGSGATFNITQWFFASAGPIITNAGSGYVEQPTVTFSGGGGSGAAAYATVGSGTTVKSMGPTVSFSSPAGEILRLGNTTFAANSANYVYMLGGPAGNSPWILSQGSDTNVDLTLQTKGTGSISLGTGQNFQQMRVSHTASAVNYVQVTGAATGGSPVISAQGSDANSNIWLTAKGTGFVGLYTAGTQPQLLVTHTASVANWMQITGATASNAPKLSVSGSDTNIDLALTPKGTGKVTTSSTFVATGGIQGGAF